MSRFVSFKLQLLQMRYYGGKGVHGKKISGIILNYISDKELVPEDLIYIEPFCGALGVFRYISPLCKRSYANDLCKDIILLWKQVQKGKFSNPKITEQKWQQLKNSKSSAERAFAGFGCSFGGVWFNGYIKDPGNNNMQYSSLIRQREALGRARFSNLDYLKFLQKQLDTKQQFLIYLDPPYKGTESHPWQRQSIDKFDSDLFWEVVKKLGEMPNVTVIVSEFSAPKSFKTIHSFKRRSGMHNTSNKRQLIEKLFSI